MIKMKLNCSLTYFRFRPDEQVPFQRTSHDPYVFRSTHTAKQQTTCIFEFMTFLNFNDFLVVQISLILDSQEASNDYITLHYRHFKRH